VLFQRARDARPDYVAKALAPARAKQPATASPLARLPFVISIGLLLATFSFPLHAAGFAQATGPPAAWGRRAWGVLYGAGVALFSADPKPKPNPNPTPTPTPNQAWRSSRC